MTLIAAAVAATIASPVHAQQGPVSNDNKPAEPAKIQQV
jgi:hypothetical protein